jgi:hypothetical protein
VAKRAAPPWVAAKQVAAREVEVKADVAKRAAAVFALTVWRKVSASAREPARPVQGDAY